MSEGEKRMNRWLVRSGHPVSQLRSELDRVFSDVFGDLLFDGGWLQRAGSRGQNFPAVNVWEDEANVYAESELPGLRMEDLELLVQGNELTIKGEARSSEEEGVTYHRRERGSRPFCGLVRLPVDIDVDKVEAELENGVLTVKLPKAASARPRKIQVKTMA
jgi:HSP20 family protein